MVEPGHKSRNRQGALHAGKEISAFLWNGGSNASLLQRTSLVIFALMFMIWAVYVFSHIPEFDSMVHRLVGFVTGLVWTFIALRLLRKCISSTLRLPS
jgi:lipopolysaccharide export LptBFGC system permease protein LptF